MNVLSDMGSKIIVGIPTIGRANILCETLRELERQICRPYRIIVCATQSADVEGVTAVAPQTEILFSGPGLPRQRNAILDVVADAGLVVFFDDDFLPQPAYLQEVARGMIADQHAVVATGTVLADGINGPGLSVEEGRMILARDARSDDVRASLAVRNTFSGYGCNMAVRLAPIRAHGIRFDERLPLYGWQEDVDFSRRLAAFGTVIRIEAARGVHLGVKGGRSSGVRLGYSQIANPLYLSGKRLGYPFRRAMTHIGCNMAMNLVRFARPEPYIDRRGRLHGNILAIRDLLFGRMMPERILDL
jgi:GT2 family glycosyltransferase